MWGHGISGFLRKGAPNSNHARDRPHKQPGTCRLNYNDPFELCFSDSKAGCTVAGMVDMTAKRCFGAQLGFVRCPQANTRSQSTASGVRITFDLEDLQLCGLSQSTTTAINAGVLSASVDA